MKLQDRFRRDFGEWRSNLPPAWRDAFADVELGFDAVDPLVEIGEDERIWPQAGGGPEGAGSLNATTKELLWKGFTKRTDKKVKKLTTLLSTLPGKHGKTRNKTEVPRRPLLAALRAESELFNTNELEFGAKPVLCHVVTLP
jgi:hypothetical protein